MNNNKQRVNAQVFDVLHEICISMVGEMPHCKALYEEFDSLMAQVKGKVPGQTWRDLHDMFMAAACEYGDEMFRLGLELGRNPDSIFDLPETDGSGNLVDGGEE